MPDLTTPPADGQQGTPPTDGGTGTPPAKPEKTFTQAELDAIIEQRLKRAVPADYEELKTIAAKAKEKEDQEKTELQKATEAQALAEKRAREAVENANARLRKAAIIEEATLQGAADNEIVIALLASSDDITVEDDGTVKGVKKAVGDLLKAKPFLAKGAAGTASGGQFGGQQHQSIDEKIAAAEAKGDYAEVRRLKVQKMVTG